MYFLENAGLTTLKMTSATGTFNEINMKREQVSRKAENFTAELRYRDPFTGDNYTLRFPVSNNNKYYYN
jgi:hypothetical protein